MIDVARPPVDVGFASPEAQGDVAKDQSVEPLPDAAKDGPRETAADAAMDAGVDSRTVTGVNEGIDATNDTVQETGPEASPETGIAQGPRCLASDGGFDFCNANEHCCVNGPARTASCATSCDADAGLYAVDCPGAAGPGGCGSQVCCGTIVFNGGVVPNCIATQLTSACVDSCNGDTVSPGASGVCAGRFTVRYCTSAADCMNDPNGNTSCCNFGSPPSPLNWCISPVSTVSLGANMCL
jgi:hypothetical protein